MRLSQNDKDSKGYNQPTIISSFLFNSKKKQMELLKKYSDPVKVKRLGKQLGVDIKPSTRKGKKYQVEVQGKTVHFGAMGMEDFTKHRDKERRKRFRVRNKKWNDAPKDTPAYWSYHILW